MAGHGERLDGHECVMGPFLELGTSSWCANGRRYKPSSLTAVPEECLFFV